MNIVQKIIKYVAIAFGIFLSFNIIAAIVLGITTVGGILIGIDSVTNDKEELPKNDEIVNIANVYDEISNLDIELSVSDIQILEGSDFKVETSTKSSEVEVLNENNTLKIKEETNKLLKDETSTVILYIPKDYTFDKVSLKTGAGKTNIEYLNANTLDIELGVGTTTIENIIAKKSTIKGGVGTSHISHFETNDLTLEIGVGKFSLNGKITENAAINCGVGKVELGLIGDSNDYAITTEIGIGAINISGDKCSNNNTYGNGSTKINMTGGIGKVDINYIDNI